VTGIITSCANRMNSDSHERAVDWIFSSDEDSSIGEGVVSGCLKR
jgi:hypothetical protein